jgi:hypothetical protein
MIRSISRKHHILKITILFAMQHWAARTLLNEAFVASNYFRTQCKIELFGTVEFDNKQRVLDG